MKITKIEIILSSQQLVKMKECYIVDGEIDPIGEFLLSPERRHYLTDDFAFSNQGSVRYELLKTKILQNKLVLLLKECN